MTIDTVAQLSKSIHGKERAEVCMSRPGPASI
jgi:hypothetical protein